MIKEFKNNISPEAKKINELMLTKEQREENERLNKGLDDFREEKRKKGMEYEKKWEKEEKEQRKKMMHTIIDNFSKVSYKKELTRNLFAGKITDKEVEAEYESYHRATEWVKENELMPHLQPATINDYKNWLRGFLENGGKPTHSYDCSIEDQINNMFVAKEDFEIMPFFGDSSVSIIVPKGIKYSGEVGHNVLYFEENYQVKGGDMEVPIYKDIKF